MALAGIGLIGTPAAGQESSEPFRAVAGADGLRASVTVRGYAVVEELVDVGGPTAQATMDAAEGAALAAHPWPGSTTFFVLDTAGARTQQPVGEQFPVARSSTSGQSESRVEVGSVVLAANSGPTASTASATGGVASDAFSAAAMSSTASVSHDPAAGTATAEAVTIVDGIVVGEALRFGAIRSVARVRSEPGAEPVRESELELSDVLIAGQEVVLRPEGLRLASSRLPLPADSPLIQALAADGITIDYIDAVETEDGVIAAGLRITVVREVPSVPEPVEVVYEVGRARAFAQGGSRSLSSDVDDFAAGVAGSPIAAMPHDSGPPALPDTRLPADAVAAAPPRPAVSAGGEGEVIGFVPGALTVDAAMFYPALIAAGVLLVCGGTFTRLFGVRLLWNS